MYKLNVVDEYMRISFVGSGRVATHLAKKFAQQHHIVQIFSRQFEHAAKLAKQVGAEAIDHYERFCTDIDLLVIAVSDQAIADVAKQIHETLPNVLIVHTSGSTDLQVLSKFHAKSGVFYPLQTFSLAQEIDWSETPLFIEVNQQQDQAFLIQLANSLSKRVYPYTSAQRLSLHLAAVFACNFSNYCYDMAKQIVDAQQVDFALLYPLILETAKKATQHAPVQVQTGPAVRQDVNILGLHQNLLEKNDRADLKEIYQLLSQAIMHRHSESKPDI